MDCLFFEILAALFPEEEVVDRVQLDVMLGGSGIFLAVDRRV